MLNSTHLPSRYRDVPRTRSHRAAQEQQKALEKIAMLSLEGVTDRSEICKRIGAAVLHALRGGQYQGTDPAEELRLKTGSPRRGMDNIQKRLARSVTFYLCNRLAEVPGPDIIKYFSCSSHSINHALKDVDKIRDADDMEFRWFLEDICGLLKTKLPWRKRAEETQQAIEKDPWLGIAHKVKLAVCDAGGITLQKFNLKIQSGHENQLRRVALWFMYKMTGFGDRKVGKYFNVNFSTVKRSIKFTEGRLTEGNADTVALVRAIFKNLGLEVLPLY